MSGNSKREKVESFIRRAVAEAIQSTAWDCPDDIALLRRHAECIKIRAGHNATEAYRFKELQDIMAWKKPPTGES